MVVMYSQVSVLVTKGSLKGVKIREVSIVTFEASERNLKRDFDEKRHSMMLKERLNRV
jgi:hypothetical protein